jgi:hypoxia up-regulated 1
VQDELKQFSSDDERTHIASLLSEAQTWMDDEAGADTKTEEYESRLADLKKATKDMFYRFEQAKVGGLMWQRLNRVYLQQRPQAIEGMRQMLNHSQFVLSSLQNLSLASGGEMAIFTETEINSLSKMINETAVCVGRLSV